MGKLLHQRDVVSGKQSKISTRSFQAMVDQRSFTLPNPIKLVPKPSVKPGLPATALPGPTVEADEDCPITETCAMPDLIPFHASGPFEIAPHVIRPEEHSMSRAKLMGSLCDGVVKPVEHGPREFHAT